MLFYLLLFISQAHTKHFLVELESGELQPRSEYGDDYREGDDYVDVDYVGEFIAGCEKAKTLENDLIKEVLFNLKKIKDQMINGEKRYLKKMRKIYTFGINQILTDPTIGNCSKHSSREMNKALDNLEDKEKAIYFRAKLRNFVMSEKKVKKKKRTDDFLSVLEIL